MVGQAGLAAARRRAARARARITTTAVARTAAAAMRVICQPGIPPVASAWRWAGSGGCLFHPGRYLRAGGVLAGSGGCLFQPGGMGRGVASAAAVVTVTVSAAAARAARARARRPRARMGFMTVSLVLVYVPGCGGWFHCWRRGETVTIRSAHRMPTESSWPGMPVRGAAGGVAALAVAGCGGALRRARGCLALVPGGWRGDGGTG